MTQEMEPTLTQLYKKTDQIGQCRIWTGATQNGMPKLNPKFWGMSYARQWAYCSTGKDLQKCKTLRNTCKNNLCINPAHLTYEFDRSELLEEFYTNVDKTKGLSPDKNKAHLGNCHWWIGASSPGGKNGNFKYGALNKNKWGERLAHRWIFKIANNIQELDSKRTINHLCNNPECVNPSHLTYSSEGQVWNLENMKQAQQEKRIHNQKFHPDQVPEIRKLILQGARTKDLCDTFKCSKSAIAEIKYNRSYPDPSYTPPKPKQ